MISDDSVGQLDSEPKWPSTSLWWRFCFILADSR